MFLRKKEKNVVTVLSVSGCGVVCWYKHLKAFQMKNHIYTLWSYLNLLGEMFVCMCVSEKEREREFGTKLDFGWYTNDTRSERRVINDFN